MSYEDNLKEISFKFKPKRMAALPGITKKDREVITHNGVDFYTNEVLRQKFIISLMKHTPVKSHKTISDLVNKKILYPAFMTKSTFQWYTRYSIDPEQDNEMSGVLGFYNPSTKKIFILIDAGYSVIGWVSDKHLAAVTLHECMHMAAKTNPTKFLRTNIKAYNDYYSEFLKFVFSTKSVNQKGLLDWIIYMHKFETSPNSSNLKKDDYLNKIKAAVKGHTKLSDEDIDDRCSYIWAYLVGTHASSGSQQMNTIRKFKNVYIALMESYKKAFRFTARTLAYQELFTPSEVICILASMELGKNKYVSNSLDIIT